MAVQFLVLRRNLQIDKANARNRILKFLVCPPASHLATFVYCELVSELHQMFDVRLFVNGGEDLHFPQVTGGFTSLHGFKYVLSLQNF